MGCNEDSNDSLFQRFFRDHQHIVPLRTIEASDHGILYMYDLFIILGDVIFLDIVLERIC